MIVIIPITIAIAKLLTNMIEPIEYIHTNYEKRNIIPLSNRIILNANIKKCGQSAVSGLWFILGDSGFHSHDSNICKNAHTHGVNIRYISEPFFQIVEG